MQKLPEQTTDGKVEKFICPHCGWVALRRNSLAGHMSGHARMSKHETTQGVVLPASAERARQAAAQPVERAQVRGSYSARARSLHTYWWAELDDVVMAFAHYQDHPKVKELLADLASAEARKSSGKADIPGCRVLSREVAA